MAVESTSLDQAPRAGSPAESDSIARELWELELAGLSSPANYSAFFTYFQTQLAECSGTTSWPAVANDLFPIIRTLKNNAQLTRTNLRTILERSHSGQQGAGTGPRGPWQYSYGTLPAFQTASISGTYIDAALTAAIRAVFAIHINLNTSRILVGQSGVAWRADQSLESLIHETFPVFDCSEEPHDPIKVAKLRARYLESYAHVKIEWTRHLPDHLKLDVGPQSKILRVFDLVSLLEISYEALRKEPWDLPLQESLKRYVLDFEAAALERT
jgi:hypothetical protein